MGYAFVGIEPTTEEKALIDADPCNKHILSTAETQESIAHAPSKGVYGLPTDTLSSIQAVFDAKPVTVSLANLLTPQEISDIIAAYFP